MAEKLGVCPLTGLLLESFNVIVIVDVADPSATTGEVPVIVELAGSAVGDVKTTVPPIFIIGVKIESVFVSAVSEARVQLEIPRADVVEQVP